MKIRIDPEFSQLIPAAPADEDAELEQAILADRQIFEPLIVWKHQNTLLDGHRRYRLMTKHPALKAPKPEVLDLESRQEAHDWIIDHQLSRRNVSDEQRRYLIGKKYLAHKPPVGKPEAASGLETTAEKIALSEGVSERTVRANAQFAEAIDAVPAEVKDAVLSGKVKATTKDLESLAKLSAKQQEKVVEAIASGKASSVKETIDEAKPDQKPKAAVDADGKPIPLKLRPFFEKAIEFEKHCRALTDIVTWVKETAESDLGVHLSALSIVADLNNAKSAIRFGKPYAICPYCKGSGQYEHEKCGNCRGIGFVGRNKLKSAPAEMRA